MKIAPGVNEIIDFNTILEELWFTTQEELDFMLEASRLEIFYETNKEVKYVSCPKVYRKLTSNKVLVMEYIEGIFIDQIEKLKEYGYDLDELGRKLAANYSKQVMEDGLFHADPHPGNILVRGGEIIWLDFGMMGTISGHGRGLLLKFTDSVVNNDANGIKEVVLSLGSAEKAINHSLLYGDIDSILSRYGTMDFGGLDIAKYLNEVLEVAMNHQIKVPSSYTMLGRGLTNLEGVIEIVAPQMNYLEVAGDHITSGLTRDVNLIKTMESILFRLGSSFDKVLETPKLLNNIMSMVMKGQAKVGMELQSSHDFEVIMTRLINNLVMGLIISALLIGSSLIATTEMKPQVLDVPLLGAVGYLAAAILSLGIILDLRKVKKS
ncbi:AarF/ABC1/UbiB kinase family protein [Acidaminobacter sp. JC074]|uniref:ABC1 kinase family protein n=1 Tax=Acidaminobacter sp. JC074 TaxID=2530199 RepID=UPI002104FF4F|nr:AarF/UbiB family protein [Acidaminobacter sp. JC074]MCH4887783.1 AarF/ABC1/UbiB kinase family protein [Acidaminobacter sp. JC074]